MSAKKDGGPPRGLEPVAPRSQDSFFARAAANPAKRPVEAAPEVSQGAWRERVFTPRAVLSLQEVLEGLKTGLAQAAVSPPIDAQALVATWLPLLRQALEQHGGDGLDVWLLELFAPPARVFKQPFFSRLGDALQGLRGATGDDAVSAAAKDVIRVVEEAGASKPTVKLSFKQLERQLEGKLEVDEVLSVRGQLGDRLLERLTEVAGVMAQLRAEIRSKPGKQPEGMYSNFVRLKVEARVLQGELKRRGVVPPGGWTDPGATL